MVAALCPSEALKALRKPNRFSAQRESDTESGLVFMRARMYDPLRGRFVQVDPLRWNRPDRHYSYVDGNPVAARDPSGAELEIDKTQVEKGDALYKQYATTKIAEEILETMIASAAKYIYTGDKMEREIAARTAVIEAARAITTLAKFDANELAQATGLKLWEAGKLVLKDSEGKERTYSILKLAKDAKAADAIRELKTNLANAQFDCTTAASVAMIIGIVESRQFTDEQLQKGFSVPPLEIGGALPGVGPQSYALASRSKKGLSQPDLLPGDWTSFSNPDAKDPVWRNENVIYAGGKKYFAHGLGKEQPLDADHIKKKLNAVPKTGEMREAQPADPIEGRAPVVR